MSDQDRDGRQRSEQAALTKGSPEGRGCPVTCGPWCPAQSRTMVGTRLPAKSEGGNQCAATGTAQALHILRGKVIRRRSSSPFLLKIPQKGHWWSNVKVIVVKGSASALPWVGGSGLLQTQRSLLRGPSHALQCFLKACSRVGLPPISSTYPPLQILLSSESLSHLS